MESNDLRRRWDEPTLEPASGRMGRLVDRVRIPVADVLRNLSPKARFALSLALVATILLNVSEPEGEQCILDSDCCTGDCTDGTCR